jgi:hypothetical protein
VIIPNRSFVVLNFSFDRLAKLTLAVAIAVICCASLVAQTIATGSIVGIVGDAKGSFIQGATLEIRSDGTGAVIHVQTSSEGLYSSGPIQPGDYSVRVDAKGFTTARLTVIVRVGNTTTANVTMQTGPEKPPREAGTPVNLEQPGVQDVLNPEVGERLPINGQNIFDLAQLEPNVQIQDGGVFDPGKNGINAISLLSDFGRQTPVTVDGLEIRDETVGANTQNIAQSAIHEFQIAQSLLDFSTGLTSSGAVNIITRSGTDQIHGELFGFYRGDEGAAALPGTPHTSFQQEQYGGDAGGAIIKDKVFLFAAAERTQQNLTAGEPFVYPFDGLDATLPEPYRDFSTDERVDWNMRKSTRAFYRFNYFQNNDTRPFSSFTSTQDMRSVNDTFTNALGVDFSTGVYTHSLRFEYLKLRSHADDATGGLGGIENPIAGLGINIGADIQGNCAVSGGGAYCGGPSWLAAQRDDQSDKLGRYDGSRVWGAHIIHYGLEFNHIDAARLAAYGAFPQAGTISVGNSTSPDPTSYAADYVTLGNGVGTYTTKNLLGTPGGGLGPDNRLQAYVGDSWKATPKITLTYGLHYVRDTGRTDNALGPLPILNQWGAGYGSRVRQPNVNFAPQFGFAWDAGGNGRTVIRGGGGLYYSDSLWDNTLFDSPARHANGIFQQASEVCLGGIAQPFIWPTALVPGSSIAGGAAVATSATTALPTFCGGTISAIAPNILALSSAFQAAAGSVGPSGANNNFVGSALSGLNPSTDLLYPGYLTPRVYQLNLGIQHEMSPGTTIGLDYVRTIGEHFLIGRDINHSGAARSFNQANALAARDAAQLANGCPAGLDQVTCMINTLGVAGAQAAYSAAGLDSNLQAAGGGPCSYCAFPGTNPLTGNTGAVGAVDMLFPSGRSLYSGFQGKLVQRLHRPWRGVQSGSLQVSYTYSRFVSQVQDQSIVNLALDNDAPTRFTGPDGMDRKHQISFGGTFDLPLYTKLSLMSHFYSPLPDSLLMPELTNGGEIFASDWLGSGLNAYGTPEPLPGTNLGQFQRGTNVNNLPSVINRYNQQFGGQLTPAGACLVAGAPPTPGNGCPGQVSGQQVMTFEEMSALGWVMPVFSPGAVAPHAVQVPWLKTMDLRVSWPFKFKDRISVEPSATVFNVFNFWNAFLPGNLPGASLIPGQNGLLAPNVIGGITPGSSLTPYRASFQSGTFALGAPRNFQFGLRVSF